MSEKEQIRLDFDREEEYRRDYFLKIELLFSALRGRSLLLSPADYQLARGWFESGIPLSCVLRGIRNAYLKKLSESDDVDEEVRSLSWCRWAVRQEWKEYKSVEPAESESTAAATRSGEEAAAILDSLVFDIKRSADLAEAGHDTALAAALRPLAEDITALKRPAAEQQDLEQLEERLRELDERMMDAADGALGEQARAKIIKSVERKLKPHRASMPPETYEATRRNAFRAKLRMALALPLLTLYSF
jgi:hypothetical protein